MRVPVVWFNGRLMEASEARTSALDRGLIWGWGLFETLRVYGGRVWALEEHMARMRRGAEVMDLQVPAEAEAGQAMAATVEANHFSDCGVRITVTASDGPPDPHTDPVGSPNVLVSAWPLRDYSALYERGARLISLTGFGRPLAGIKSTSYGVSVAGRVAARRAGVDDALFLDSDGTVLETTGANIMVVKGDALITPPTPGVLPGVTRGIVLDVAQATGLKTQERRLVVDDLHEAEEVLLTSSLREVYGASELDGRPLRTGPHAQRLREAFGERVREILGGRS